MIKLDNFKDIWTHILGAMFLLNLQVLISTCVAIVMIWRLDQIGNPRRGMLYQTYYIVCPNYALIPIEALNGIT